MLTTTILAEPSADIIITMSRQQAEQITNRIRGTVDELWRLLLTAYEGRAWEALGYDTFRAYAKAEFAFGQAHAYRLLDQGRVVKALEAATHSPMGEIVSERVARELKPLLPEVIARVTDAVDAGIAPLEAVHAAIQAVRTETRARPGVGPAPLAVEQRAHQYESSTRKADRSNRAIAATVALVTCAIDLDPVSVDFGALDRECIPVWLAGLRRAKRSIEALEARLERELRG